MSLAKRVRCDDTPCYQQEEDESALETGEQRARRMQRRYDEWSKAKLKKLTRDKIVATVKRILEDLHEDGGSDLRWWTSCEEEGRSYERGVHFSYVEGDLEIWDLEDCSCALSDEHGAVDLRPLDAARIDPSQLAGFLWPWVEESGCCVVTLT